MKTRDHLIDPHFGFRYKHGELHAERVPISKLTERFGSPLYVYSASAIRESYRRLTGALRGLPVQICYAMKANSNLKVLELLKSEGAGVDLVSYGEWCRAELAKIPRKKRVLSGVAKTLQELFQLFQFPNAGVASVHVESVMELETISLICNMLRRPVTVGLRYNPDVDAKTIEQISTGRRKDKFGLTREEILTVVEQYGFDPFMKIDGMSIHIGSQITQIAPYERAFKQLKKRCTEVERVLGRKLGYVDVGGGLGVQYLNEKTISLKAYASLVKKYFGDYDQILLEPGRSLVANSGILVSEVVYSKIRSDNRTLILDAGMNDLMRPALYSAYHQIVPVSESRKTPAREWDVVGGICETTDYFARKRKIALTGEAGEQVAFLSSGAYGFSMSHSYNTRPRVAEVLVDGAKVRLIRKRETIEDLIVHELDL